MLPYGNETQKISKPQCSSLDIPGMKIFGHFYKNLTAQSLKKRVLVENPFPFFKDFPIQIAEKARVVPIFVASYLGNRCELRDKWAHFGN